MITNKPSEEDGDFRRTLQQGKNRGQSTNTLIKRIDAINSPVDFETPAKIRRKKSVSLLTAKTLKDKLKNFSGLHKVCFIAKGESDPLWELGLEMLRGKTIEEKKEIAQLKQNGMIPLFMACQRQPPVSIVKALIDAFPGSLYYKNNFGLTCLHSACKFNASEDVIRLLVERHPNRIEAVEAVTNRNENPMLLYMYSNNGEPPSISTFKLLLTPQVMTHDDENYYCPLDFICYYPHRCDSSLGLQLRTTRREHCMQIFDAYLDTKPNGTSTFLKEAANFPSWLQNRLIQHMNMRRILNFRITQKLTTAFFMLDFYTNILLLISFTEIIMHKQKEEDYDSWNACLIFCIVYLSFREILQIVSFSYWDYISDVWNWLDCLQIFLVSICAYGFRPDNNFNYNQIATATGFLIWITMASFLRAAYLPFSVMIMGVIKVTKVLLPFMVIIFCFLSSFALLAFTGAVAPFDDTSKCGMPVNSSNPFCTFGDALYTSYILFIGAEEYEAFKEDEANKVRALVFLSISTTILLNVIIAIVNDSFGSVSDEAERLFWLNRLHFISEIEGVRNFFTEDSFIAEYIDEMKKEKRNQCFRGSLMTRRGKLKSSSHLKIDEYMYKEYSEEGNYISIVNRERLICDILVSSVYFYDDPKDRWKKEDIFKVMNNGEFRWLVETKLIARQIVATLILPFWGILGLLSFGWFWPPQVREFLFCIDIEKNSVANIEQNTNDDSGKSHKDIRNNNQDIRLQILEEEMKNVMNELGHMKNAVNDMRLDYHDIKKELLDELKLVRSVLLRVNMKLNMFD